MQWIRDEGSGDGYKTRAQISSHFPCYVLRNPFVDLGLGGENGAWAEEALRTCLRNHHPGCKVDLIAFSSDMDSRVSTGAMSVEDVSLEPLFVGDSDQGVGEMLAEYATDLTVYAVVYERRTMGGKLDQAMRVAMAEQLKNKQSVLQLPDAVRMSKLGEAGENICIFVAAAIHELHVENDAEKRRKEMMKLAKYLQSAADPGKTPKDTFLVQRARELQRSFKRLFREVCATWEIGDQVPLMDEAFQCLAQVLSDGQEAEEELRGFLIVDFERIHKLRVAIPESGVIPDNAIRYRSADVMPSDPMVLVYTANNDKSGHVDFCKSLAGLFDKKAACHRCCRIFSSIKAKHEHTCGKADDACAKRRKESINERPMSNKRAAAAAERRVVSFTAMDIESAARPDGENVPVLVCWHLRYRDADRGGVESSGEFWRQHDADVSAEDEPLLRRAVPENDGEGRRRQRDLRRKYLKCPVDAFLDLILHDAQFKGTTVVAHNGSAYDYRFLRLALLRLNYKTDVIVNSGRIYQMQVRGKNNVKFIDSFLHFRCSLAALPTMFGLHDAIEDKGDFPHKFNTLANYDGRYDGEMPDISMWELEKKTEKKARALEEWHEGNRGATFNLRTEMLQYCRGDVEILLAAVEKYSDTTISELDVDAMCYCTVGSFVMGTFQAKFMPEYAWWMERPPNNVSKAEDGWIAYLEHTEFGDAHLKRDVNVPCGTGVQTEVERAALKKCFSDVDVRPMTHAELHVGAHPCSCDAYLHVRKVASKTSANFGKYYLHCPTCDDTGVSGMPEYVGWFTDVSSDTAEKLAKACVVIRRAHASMIVNCDAVDLDSQPRQVFRYHGCPFHGCEKCLSGQRFSDHEARRRRVRDERTQLESCGYRVHELWSCEDNTPKSYQNASFHPREALKGGRCEPFRLWAEADGVHTFIRSYDVTSLYPTVNALDPAPAGQAVNYSLSQLKREYVGYAQGSVLDMLQKIFENDGDHVWFVKCTCWLTKSHIPLLPIHHDKKLMFVNGVVREQTYFSIELLFAIQQGRVTAIEVLGAKRYRRVDGIMAAFMSHFFPKKWANSGKRTQEECDAWVKRAREEKNLQVAPLNAEDTCDNPGLKALSKLGLNNLWGKSASRTDTPMHVTLTRPGKVIDAVHDPANKNVRVEVYMLDEENDECYFEVKYGCVDYGKRDPSPIVNTAIGAATTACARVRLAKMLVALDPEQSLYTDTDSSYMYIDRRNPKHVDPATPEGVKYLRERGVDIGSHLGDWEYEDTYTGFVCLGPKTYATKTAAGRVTVKAKGVPKNRGNDAALTFARMMAIARGSGDTIETSMTTIVRQGLIQAQRTKTMTRHVGATFKRIPDLETGLTQAVELE